MNDRWRTEDSPDLCSCEDTGQERYQLLNQRIVNRLEVPDQPERIHEVERIVADVAVEIRLPAFKADWIFADEAVEAGTVVARPVVLAWVVDLTSPGKLRGARRRESKLDDVVEVINVLRVPEIAEPEDARLIVADL